MIPIFEQLSGSGQGYAQDEFLHRFEEICQQHLREKRARAFAFIFYDPSHGRVREALRNHAGFQRLDDTSDNDVSLFFMHDNAVERGWRRFNKKFLRAANISDLVTLPCMLFFRFDSGDFCDANILILDEKNKDPVTLTNDMVHFLKANIGAMNKEGDMSALKAIPELIFSAGKFGSLVSFFEKFWKP